MLTDMIPRVGARATEQLAGTLAAVELELTASDRAAIERAVMPGAAAGERYPAAPPALLDSERS